MVGPLLRSDCRSAYFIAPLADDARGRDADYLLQIGRKVCVAELSIDLPYPIRGTANQLCITTSIDSCRGFGNTCGTFRHALLSYIAAQEDVRCRFFERVRSNNKESFCPGGSNEAEFTNPVGPGSHKCNGTGQVVGMNKITERNTR
jgi:hypothetical protein